MYAVVETSGRQYFVVENQVIETELQRGYNPGDEIVFDRVLMVRDSENVAIGRPYVEGARVVGRVLEHFKGPKLLIVKVRPRKNSRTKKGHRQWYSRIKIEKIEYGEGNA